jgi:hypothetical protein
MKWWIIAGISLFVALLSSSASIAQSNTSVNSSSIGPIIYIIHPAPNEIYSGATSFSPPSDIDAIIAQLPSGKAIFNPPSEMTKNTTNRVSAIINRSNISTGETVKVTPVMEAYLKGSSFDIKDITEPRQIVTNASNTTWFWDVTPYKEGNQTLHLVIYIIINNDKKAITYDRTIAVEVNPKEQQADQWKEILSIGGTFIFILVGIMYFFKDTINEFVKKRFLR